MNGSTRFIGNEGEEKACEFLVQNGYRIIERNYKCKYGEIDIIAVDDNTLCFIEVKMRNNTAYGPPYHSVTPRKQKQISYVALNYLSKIDKKYSGVRFDVVSINMEGDEERIELFRGAFEGVV